LSSLCRRPIALQGDALNWEYLVYASFVIDMALNFFSAFNDRCAALRILDAARRVR
jgi:hypothetical protein